ncbi:MAG: hypothetical protein WAX12_00225 [Candidatus Microthrix subdominans]
MDSSVSSGVIVGCRRWANSAVPKNPTPRMTPIQVSVVAALRDSGFLNAGTPLEIASTPVNATAPDENARSNRKGVSIPSVEPLSVNSASAPTLGGSGARLPV